MPSKTGNIEIRTGYSNAEGESIAVEQLAQQLEQPNLSFAVIFTSSLYDSRRISDHLNTHFPCPVFGCTTSGEITPKGYLQHSITGFSVAGEGFVAHPFLLQSLNNPDTNNTVKIIKELRDSFQEIRRSRPERNTFGMLLIDGLSVMEERVIAILADAVGDIPIVGGSAGDDLRFEKTYVFANRSFFSDAAVFVLFETVKPFVPLITQHFTATDDRLIITKTSPENRVVYEINGRPAAQEYARAIGFDPKDINPEIYSTHPVMLRIGGKYYIRSIQKANEDGSLTFYCAIEEGLVLRIGSCGNLVDNLAEAFETVRNQIQTIKLTIGFDCILRLLEVNQKKLAQEVNEIFNRNRVIGFNTYGEQFNSVHVNQTFTGIVLGH